MSAPGSLMQGKKGLIMGVANDRSIAWGIARMAAQHGAELAFTFQGEALERRVRPLAASVNSPLVLPCDVTDDASLDATFAAIEKQWGRLDFAVHAIAGGPSLILGSLAPVYQAAQEAGVRRLVYLSTASVHGQAPEPGTTESTPLGEQG